MFAGVQFVSMKEHCNMHQKSSEEGRLEGHLDAFYIRAAGESEVLLLKEEVLPISHLHVTCACCLPAQAAAQKLGPAHTIVERGRQVPFSSCEKLPKKERSQQSDHQQVVNCISALFRISSNSGVSPTATRVATTPVGNQDFGNFQVEFRHWSSFAHRCRVAT